MPVETMTAPVRALPPAANGVGVTPNSSAWANGAWVEHTAAAASDLVLFALVVHTGGTERRTFEVDVGVGGAGSEVVVATHCGRVANGNYPDVGCTAPLVFPIPIAAIASGQRIALRWRQSNTLTTACRVALLVATPPIGGTQATTTRVPTHLPSAGQIEQTMSTTSWGNTAWIEVTASAASAFLLAGVMVHGGNVSQEDYETDVGVGGAGAEAVITTMRAVMANASIGNNAPGPQFYPLWSLLDAIASGNRVAVRFRKRTTNSSQIARLKLLVYAKPV